MSAISQEEDTVAPKSNYRTFEHSMWGFLTQNEAEQWIEDNRATMYLYADQDWPVTETVKYVSGIGAWMASLKASKP